MSWQRLINGLIIIIIGAILLANTNGYLPWSVWHTALNYWPLLIVGLGVQVAFSKWKIPGMALSIIIILILAAANPHQGFYYKYEYRYKFPLSRTAELNEKEVAVPLNPADSEFEMALSAPSMTVEVRGEPGLNLGTSQFVLTGTLVWDKIEPAIDYRSIDDNKIWAQIKTVLTASNAGKQEWDLLVNPSLQTHIKVTGGVSNLKLDCTAVHIKSLSVSTGVTRLDLILGLSGGETIVEVSSGVAYVDMTVPKEAGIKVMVSGPPLLVTSDFSDQGLVKHGNHWVTPDYEDASTKVDLYVSCGVGKINLHRSSTW